MMKPSLLECLKTGLSDAINRRQNALLVPGVPTFLRNHCIHADSRRPYCRIDFLLI